MKSRIMLWIFSAVLAAYTVSAQVGCPYASGSGSGYGMMGGLGWFGGGLVWLLFVALAAFVFALVFWGTKRLLIPESHRHAQHSVKKK